ncbi:pupal cuticle protein-like [Trichogramma pretiosum]|uniref:pupal cuticle protein-like n=1 Tax=Trichogramma pretiosum TaxID=7493 RepID=UPI0006C9604C|nr:pupal cuticle protein-like [Trichogramma pretiosum]
MIAIILLSVIATVLGSPQYYHGAPHAYAPHGGAAPLGPDGRVVDTPEVAHAKSAHLAALAEAAARAPKGPVGHYDAPVHAHGLAYAPHAAYAHGPRYSGPPAPLGPDGRVIDTPEVEHAKAIHFSLYNAEVQKAGPPGPVHGPALGHYGAPVYHDGSYNPAHDYY